jgi:hypothetical protein
MARSLMNRCYITIIEEGVQRDIRVAGAAVPVHFRSGRFFQSKVGAASRSTPTTWLRLVGMRCRATVFRVRGTTPRWQRHALEPCHRARASPSSSRRRMRMPAGCWPGFIGTSASTSPGRCSCRSTVVARPRWSSWRAGCRAFCRARLLPLWLCRRSAVSLEREPLPGIRGRRGRPRACGRCLSRRQGAPRWPTRHDSG